MTYQIVLKPSVVKELEKLPDEVAVKIERCIDSLAFAPRPAGVVKMQGEAGLWRLRVGRYRIVYEIHDTRLLILVLRIGHRKDIYR